MRTLEELTRPNIWRLKPYSSARDEYNGAAASVFLDANENPYNMPHNRYPDPMVRIPSGLISWKVILRIKLSRLTPLYALA